MNQTNDDDPPSLEYIEDPYISPTAITSETPSLDELDNFEYLDPNELDIFDLRQLDFDELNANSLTSLSGNDESINVEAEFFKVKRANAIIRAFFKNDFKRSVRVTYCDLTKPYLAKLPKESNFRRYLDISKGDGKKSPMQIALKFRLKRKHVCHLILLVFCNCRRCVCCWR